MAAHLLDLLAGLALRFPNPGTVIFPDGWGDRARLDLFRQVGDPVDDQDNVSLDWEPKQEHRGFRRRRGTFPSPLGMILPAAAGRVSLEVTEPAAGTNRAVLLFPSWNEEGFGRRRLLAQDLARRGIATIVPELAFYGRRRPGPGTGMPIRTVSDFALMGAAALREARSLLAAFSKEFPRLGVGGFSMGATLAALTSCQAEETLAVGVMAAAPSPCAVYLEGALRHAISWKALGGPRARDELAELLDSASALLSPPLPHHRSAVMVAATSDGFVPPAESAALADHWAGAELRWMRGGHATLWARHRAELPRAIADSFERLTAPGTFGQDRKG